MTPEPILVTTAGATELWALGEVSAVMPRLDPSWPQELRAAWHRRLMASLTLRCECGAVATQSAVGGQMVMEHEDNCGACDHRMVEMLWALSP